MNDYELLSIVINQYYVLIINNKYFEFLKYLREKHGETYSTRIHQKAAKLALAKEQD